MNKDWTPRSETKEDMNKDWTPRSETIRTLRYHKKNRQNEETIKNNS